jgi:hypothetical protein
VSLFLFKLNLSDLTIKHGTAEAADRKNGESLGFPDWNRPQTTAVSDPQWLSRLGP